jgi:hypothetical protein
LRRCRRGALGYCGADRSHPKEAFKTAGIGRLGALPPYDVQAGEVRLVVSWEDWAWPRAVKAWARAHHDASCGISAAGAQRHRLVARGDFPSGSAGAS